jgi:uncharacterized protein with HEPN domain
MSKAEDAIRLCHMLDAATKIKEFVAGYEKVDFKKDEKSSLAVVRLLEVLGEAAKSLSEECRGNYPQIPWRQIAGTRDRLIHGYFDIDLDIVWNIVYSDLPALIVQLEKAVQENTE